MYVKSLIFNKTHFNLKKKPTRIPASHWKTAGVQVNINMNKKLIFTLATIWWINAPAFHVLTAILPYCPVPVNLWHLQSDDLRTGQIRGDGWTGGHLTNTPISGSFPKCCHKVRSPSVQGVFVYCTISLHWNWEARTCSNMTKPLCTTWGL